MNNVGAKRIAWGAAIVSVILMMVGIGLSGSYMVKTGDVRPLLSHQGLIPFLTIAYAAIGAVVAGHHPRNPIGWIFVSVGLLSGMNAIGVGTAVTAGAAAVETPIWSSAVTWLNRWIWIPGTFLPTVFVFLYFPDGTLPSPRWRPIAWAGGLGLAFLVGGIMIHPGPLASWGVEGPNPVGVVGLTNLLDRLVEAGTVLSIVGFIGSLAALVVRFRRSRGVQRAQMKWLVYASGWMVLSFVAGSSLSFLLQDARLAEEMSIAISSLSILAIAVAASVAILKHRLYDIDLIINRTLVYAGLTASVAAIYLLLVGATTFALQFDHTYAALILTGVFGAAALRPLRGIYQRGADRVVPPESPIKLRALSDADVLEQRESQTSARWTDWARKLWPWFAFLSMAVLVLSLPAYIVGLGDGPPDMVADQSSMGSFVLTVDILNALFSLAAAGTSFALAWILFRSRRTGPMGVFLAYFLPLYGIVIAGPLEEIALFLELPLDSVITYEAVIIAVPSLLLLFLFPDGRFVPRWTKWLGLGSVALVSLFTLTPPFVGLEPGDPMTWIGVVTWSVLGWIGLGAQIYRYRRVSSPIERQQTKVAVAGLVLWVAVLGLSSIPYVLRQQIPATSPMPWWAPLSELSWFIGLGILPAALTLAVLRYRLWDVDVALNRAISYAALTATIVAMYVVLVGGLGLLFQSRGSFTISLLATGLVAVMFQPVRDRLQRGVNRLMYGERDEPYKVLSDLGQRLETTIAPGQVLPTIVEAVAEALKLPYTAIEVSEGDRTWVAAEYGRPVEEPIAVPLSYQGEKIGRLLCATRGPGEEFNAAELRLLADLAHQAGLAVHAVQLTADLKRSRERLVMTREEERRRLRRDLHDGLGPELAGMMLKLDAAQNLIRRDPEGADRLLADLKDQTQDALADIRRLVYNLRPPALDELGLIEAIRQRVEVRVSGQDPRVVVKGPEAAPALPAAVEVAAYRIALEAVTNVTRHAGASRCEVRFEFNRTLTLEVIDNGRGIADDITPGVGLTSMRERASELGGSVKLEGRPDGGTRLVAQLPLDRKDL